MVLKVHIFIFHFSGALYYFLNYTFNYIALGNVNWITLLMLN